jgi:signal peptide peptidase SppA
MRFLTNGLSGREPLLIDPTKAKDHAVLAEKFGFTDMLAQLFGTAPQPYVVDGIGVIPIVGVIGKGLSPMEKMMGAVDVADISAAVDAFAASPEVNSIALQISSPGGTVTGVEELANKVRNLKKPTMAYTDSEMASAAYWIGSAADRVVASPSSTVGSIGVYLAIPDYSKAAEMAGIKMVVLKSGKFKGAGIEGTSLNADQVQNLQASVDSIHADFKAAVNMKRKMVKADSMEGQTFSGKQASQIGLVGALADSFTEALAKFAGASSAVPTAVHAFAKGGKAITLLKAKASDIEEEVLSLLTPRQREMVDELEGIEETFGPFDQTSGPDGAHYVAASPFTAQGLLCQNCVFYRGPRGCGLVSGDIDPNGICKLWVIPGNLVKE